MISTLLKRMVATKPDTVKPAFSTFFFIISKSTVLFGLNNISKVYVLMSASTLRTKSSVFNALFMELLHILQVKPLAFKETLVTCAFVATEKAMAINKKIVFIIVFVLFSY